jgi:hypothetical protein
LNTVLKVLTHPDGTNIRKRELSNFDKNDKDIPSVTPSATAGAPEDPAFRVPPMTAIAGVLISKWAKGEVDGLVEGLIGPEAVGDAKARI